MRKVILAFSIAAISLGSANAQDAGSIKFGIKAGANFSNLKYKSGGNSESGDMKVGFHAGAFVNIPAGTMFSINPELVYSVEGAKEKDQSDFKENLSYINVPVLVQYNNPSGFLLETGPQIGFLMSAKAKGGGASVDIKDQFKSTNFSWALGAGYKTASGVGFNARYNLGLSNIAKDAGSDESLKASTIQVSLFKSF